jgi:glutamate carboxypeptidase
MTFALCALRDLGIAPMVTPVVLVNSDEEIGSRESARWIHLLARLASRVFVLEPALGRSGKLKTARKGVGKYKVRVRGKAAHAGLEPGAGASAIVELSHVVQRLHALNDAERGVTVNVGMIEGGLRSNVVAPEARAVVDVRVPTEADARRIEAAIDAIEAETPGTVVEITGGVGRPPMERTPRNAALWMLAAEAAAALGIQLDEGTAGGGSDGNLTSQYAATLDGLGAVGDGAHADHEYVEIDRLAERAALLALLLLAPPLGAPTTEGPS